MTAATTALIFCTNSGRVRNAIAAKIAKTAYDTAEHMCDRQAQYNRDHNRQVREWAVHCGSSRAARVQRCHLSFVFVVTTPPVGALRRLL
jgi:hypothetical protein